MSFLQRHQRLLSELRQKLFNSRFFTISALLHIVLLIALGGTVIMQQTREQADFTGGDSEGKIVSGDVVPPPPPPPPPTEQPVLTPTAQNSTAMEAITTTAPTPTNFTLPPIAPPMPTAPVDINKVSVAAPPVATNQTLTTTQAVKIRDFTKSWSKGGGGPGSSVKEREFEFTAYLAKYQNGDWDSTNTIKDKDTPNETIKKGSLSNLLYFMNKLSKGKIKADPIAKPLSLSSEDIFVKKPPVIFFTGHRDFVLTQQEVENLQKYVQVGGCIWGDSSLPGRYSRFDIAFRREMRRVIPDVDKDWEALPKDYPMFKKNLYYPEITAPPSGINYYKEPVYALRFGGEVAIIYTANDYGDMWRLALTTGTGNQLDVDKTREDGPTNTFRRLKYTDDTVFGLSDRYYRGMEVPRLVDSYKFGTNVVIHLLTRWEDRIKAIPKGL